MTERKADVDAISKSPQVLNLAPTQEPTLVTHALNLLSAALTEDSGSGFVAPSLDDFYPEAVLFAGTPFEMNRIMLIRVFVVTVLAVVFLLMSSRFKKAVETKNYVPSRFQLIGEISLNFVRTNIARDQLGEKDGDRFLPLLTTIFFVVFGMNITGIIPGFNVAGSSLIGLGIVLAVAAYVTFIYAGIKRHGGKFFTSALFPAGVPPVFYILVTPIELLSTFILRPITLALRLTMNMVAGHLLLVLCFSATDFFIFQSHSLWAVMGAGTFLFGFIFTLFEILVAFLQAYVFTLLTTVYIQLALADEH